jgi:recombinational DNA repair protein RecT
MAQQDNRQQKPAPRDEKAVVAIVTQAQQEFSVIAQSDKLVEWSREAAFARQMILNDEYLYKATPQSVVNAIVNIANVGLTLSPVQQFCALIARWDKKAGVNVASLMVMYKGLLKLATDVGLDACMVENVYEKDDFRFWVDDDGEHISYEKNFRAAQDTETNPYIGTFVRAKFKHYAGTFIEWVPVDEMIKIREASDAYDPEKPWCVWIKWAGEQRKKSALKRASKRWPKTTSKEWERLDKAVAIDNEVEGAKLKRAREREEATDAETTEHKKITPEQVAEIVSLCRESGVSPYRLGMAYQVKSDNDGKGLEELTTDKYEEVVERLKTAAAEKKQRDGKKD